MTQSLSVIFSAAHFFGAVADPPDRGEQLLVRDESGGVANACPLGGKVDRGQRSGQPIQCSLDAGRARGTSHSADREFEHGAGHRGLGVEHRRRACLNQALPPLVYPMRVYEATCCLHNAPCANAGVGGRRSVPPPNAKSSKPAACGRANRLDFAIRSSPRAGGRYDICLEGAARRLWMG